MRGIQIPKFSCLIPVNHEETDDILTSASSSKGRSSHRQLKKLSRNYDAIFIAPARRAAASSISRPQGATATSNRH